jgi:hypothetical protein
MQRKSNTDTDDRPEGEGGIFLGGLGLSLGPERHNCLGGLGYDDNSVMRSRFNGSV